jgi:hypothetical protein
MSFVRQLVACDLMAQGARDERRAQRCTIHRYQGRRPTFILEA